MKIVAFLVVSLLLGYLSRKSLRSWGCHGFYRFFAWEAMVALFLLNVDDWFRDPWSVHQLASWTLLTLSVFPVLAGLYLLKRRGKPAAGRTDPGLLGWEKTTELIDEGVFHYIRHPMYSSLLLLAWGIFFKAPSWPGCVLVVAASVFLWLTAKVEEGENLRYFGPAYADYRRHTWRFLPFVH
jgi:protein-S-isoprenylcysteine O-methyltransferase Ste14